MGISPSDQAKITQDLATAVKLVLADRQSSELATLDPRAVAMAFVMHACAIMRATGAAYSNLTDMTSSAWNGDTVKMLMLAGR